jgi:hypothetical protein
MFYCIHFVAVTSRHFAAADNFLKKVSSATTFSTCIVKTVIKIKILRKKPECHVIFSLT